MRSSIVVASLLATLSLAAPLRAQRVGADIVIRSGPVAGRVNVANGYSTYRRPVVYRRAPGRVIVVERYAPRAVAVERVHRLRHWHRQGYRQVTLFYANGRYFEREYRGWPDRRAVVVLERNGRYYLPDEWRDGHGDHRHWND
jgi:hypothetical protein